MQLVDSVVSKAISCGFESLFRYIKQYIKNEDTITNGLVAQLEEATDLNPVQCGFESHQAYKFYKSTKFS